MNEIHWEPTAHLRFVSRLEEILVKKYSDGTSVNELKKVKVLKQKWIGKRFFSDALFEEWRDVPLEVGNEDVR